MQPPERQKLQRVAEVLNKRERLKLTVHGGYEAKADGEALRALQDVAIDDHPTHERSVSVTLLDRADVDDQGAGGRTPGRHRRLASGPWLTCRPRTRS